MPRMKKSTRTPGYHTIKEGRCSICGYSLRRTVVAVGTGNGSMNPCASLAHRRCYDQAERLFKKGEVLYNYA